jgi:hypothetical protein
MSLEKAKTNSSPPSDYTAEQKAHEEGWKLKYDIYKHLTTLNTGSILLLVTFLEKLFQRPLWKGLVIVALFLFVFSIVTALLAMIVLSDAVQYMGIKSKVDERSLVFIIVAWGCFLLGIISMIIFALKNLFI